MAVASAGMERWSATIGIPRPALSCTALKLISSRVGSVFLNVIEAVNLLDRRVTERQLLCRGETVSMCVCDYCVCECRDGKMECSHRDPGTCTEGDQFTGGGHF